MLVAQATCAAEIFTGEPVPASVTESIYKAILAKKQNIVLVGMPSCGKSTVGGLLAEQLGRECVDSDAAFAEMFGMTPAAYIRAHGEEAFRARESEVLRTLAAKNGIVLATGGGAVLREENLNILRQNGRIYWLDRPLCCLSTTSDRPLSDSTEKLQALFAKRAPLYSAAADVHVQADGTAAESASAVLQDFLN